MVPTVPDIQLIFTYFNGYFYSHTSNKMLLIANIYRLLCLIVVEGKCLREERRGEGVPFLLYFIYFV